MPARFAMVTAATCQAVDWKAWYQAMSRPSQVPKTMWFLPVTLPLPMGRRMKAMTLKTVTMTTST
jgi:hypothetical protein